MTKLERRIKKLLEESKKAYSLKEIFKIASVKRADTEKAKVFLLDYLEQGFLVEKNGKYALVSKLGLLKAEIVKVNANFGFARPEDDKMFKGDIFIPGHSLMGTMPGDTVLIKAEKNLAKNLPDGKVYAVVKESNRPFSGTLELNGKEAYIVPDSYVKFPVKVSFKSIGKLKNGDKIHAKIIKRSGKHSGHIAEITASFGSSLTAKACAQSIILENGISAEFNEDVREQAAALSSGFGIHPKEIDVRLDLRDDIIFTIDSSDAKDLDDAVSIKKTADGWQLSVHIADVSYYVTHNSPIDKEAFARGASLYYADKSIPMLPRELSNGICSLNPNEDRLAFTSVIDIDRAGNILHFNFVKTVIRSKIKGVYSEINSILDGTAAKETEEKYKDLRETIFLMQELAAVLSGKRFGRGSVNIETTESRIITDEKGKAVSVSKRESGASENIIEEFMLTANEAAAKFVLKSKIPAVFRVHEHPSEDKTKALYDTLDVLGIGYGKRKDSIGNADLNRILKKVKDTNNYEIISFLVLRSMAKARYSNENTGHFGLALENYLHFTSPIRRYPDLVTHRIMSSLITGMKYDNIVKRYKEFTRESALQSTNRELAILNAERSCNDCYVAEYMSGFIGETFTGIISSVTSFGVYVRLENTAEGLVRVSDFPAGQWVLENALTYKNASTRKTIRLSDTVKVKITGCNISAGEIDMVLSE